VLRSKSARITEIGFIILRTYFGLSFASATFEG
jgi:hypothetical protein